jgi:hypothetical protein
MNCKREGQEMRRREGKVRERDTEEGEGIENGRTGDEGLEVEGRLRRGMPRRGEGMKYGGQEMKGGRRLGGGILRDEEE